MKKHSIFALKLLAPFALVLGMAGSAAAAPAWKACTITNIGQLNATTQHVKCVEKLTGNVDQYHVQISTTANDASARFIQAALAAKLAGRVFNVLVDSATPTTGICSGSSATLCRVPTGWYFN